MATASSRDLSERDCGRDSLLLAGEIRRAQAAAICGDCGSATRVESRRVDLQATAKTGDRKFPTQGTSHSRNGVTEFSLSVFASFDHPSHSSCGFDMSVRDRPCY